MNATRDRIAFAGAAITAACLWATVPVLGWHYAGWAVVFSGYAAFFAHRSRAARHG